jgi:hypothetical protein
MNPRLANLRPYPFERLRSLLAGTGIAVLSAPEALEAVYLSTGKSVILSALTTAVPLLRLVVISADDGDTSLVA